MVSSSGSLHLDVTDGLVAREVASVFVAASSIDRNGCGFARIARVSRVGDDGMHVN
jgi:hypothetical protein